MPGLTYAFPQAFLATKFEGLQEELSVFLGRSSL